MGQPLFGTQSLVMKLICIYDAHAVSLSRIWFTALFLSQSAVESMLSGLLEEHRVRMEEE
jgi:hypothetical protein